MKTTWPEMLPSQIKSSFFATLTIEGLRTNPKEGKKVLKGLITSAKNMPIIKNVNYDI